MLSVSIYKTANLLLIANLKHTKGTQTKILHTTKIVVTVICLISFSVSVEDKLIVYIFWALSESLHSCQ